MKLKRFRGIILLMLMIAVSSSMIYADGSKSWCLEHEIADMNFNGNVNFQKGYFWYKSIIAYFGYIGGPDKGLSLLSIDANNNYFRAPSDEVGTLYISTKNCNDGNCVKEYIASNRRVSTTQYKDYLKKINVDIWFGTTSIYTEKHFSIE